MGVYFSDAQQTRAGHLVNFAKLSNNTRRTLAGSVSNNEMVLCDFGNYNKQESGSILVISGFVSGKNDYNQFCTLNFKIGTSYDGNYITTGGGTGSDYPSLAYTYGGETNGSKHVTIHTTISGHTTTGAQKMIATYRSADGGSDRPFPLLNPNSQDSGALEGNPGMNGSTILVWEVLQ